MAALVVCAGVAAAIGVPRSIGAPLTPADASRPAAVAPTAQPPTPLPYQSKDRHLGVASCASSVCHGAIQPPARPGPLMNEFVTWSHDDAHARAFQALTSPRGRSIAAKLGLEAAETAAECLGCHADNVAPNRRGDKFILTEGVGCEACHGGAERWIASHTAKSSYRADVKTGLYPTADLRERQALCLSCHLGNTDKFATHRIMGAGHPRLSFELDTFLALEPVHYRIDAPYRARKPAYSRTQTWMSGQLLAAQAQLRLLEGPLAHSARTFPEIALFNCTSCHDASMTRLEWRPRQLTGGIGPGNVLLNDSSIGMSWVIARTVELSESDAVQRLTQALQRDAVGDWQHLAVSSAQLRTKLGEVLSRVQAAPPTLTARRLLDNLLQAGIDGEFRDYLGAEQAVMAIDLLLLEAGVATAHAGQRDELYHLVRDDQAYRPAAFSSALNTLRESLR